MSATVRRAIPRSRGPGRAIVATVIVVLALFAAADLGLRFWAQQWLEDRVDDALGLGRPAELSLGGFPFLPQFVQGRFDSVGIVVEGVEIEGVRLERAALDLAGVTFDRADLLVRRAGVIAVGRGSGEVWIGEADLNAFLRARGVGVAIELLGPRVRASAILTAGGEEASASASGRLRLDGEALAFEPAGVEVEGSFGVPPAALAFEVGLPALLPGMSYEGVQVRRGSLTLRAGLHGARLDVDP